VPQKGFDTLIRAFADSKITSHDVLLAGDGTERAALETLVKETGMEKRIHFTGKADRALAVSLFKGASFVALPSRADEGLPVVTVETMAAGKAIVATAVGGVPESVIHRETGLITPREDVPAFCRAISELAENSELRNTLGAAALQRAQRFAWPVIADEYLAIYRQVLKAHA
jgi:glycosyltransferase involved in cell wall biosynthesis